MPINSGRRGFAGILGVPALRRASALDPQSAMQATGGGPLGSGVLTNGRRGAPFRSPSFSTAAFTVSGVTRDSTGAPIGGCAVELFLSDGDTKVDAVVSNGAGAFVFAATAGPYYLVAYKAGVPDVAGTSVNTLAGA